MKFAIFFLVLISFDFSKKQIALTFDDGPCNNGETLLDELKNAGNIKATFFLVGNDAANFKPQLERALSEGHEIGCHGWDSNPSVEEIKLGQQQITEAKGGTCKLYRAPNLSYGAVIDACKELGFPLIGSNLVGEDWNQGENTLTTQQVEDKIVNGAYDGAIALLHWPNTAPQTVAAVAGIVDRLKADYDFLTVSELAAAKGVTLQRGQRYDSMISCNGLNSDNCRAQDHCQWVGTNSGKCATRSCIDLACTSCERESTCIGKGGCVWNQTACAVEETSDTDNSWLATPPRLFAMVIASVATVFLAGLFA